jgi:hypothetical protein
MKKVKFILIALWSSVASYFSAGWIALTYMFITGHSKGYAYDLGSEKDISILFGIGMLGIWIVAIIPTMIWLCIKCYRYKKPFVLFPIIGFILLFALGIYLIGLNKFIGYFGFGPTPFR